MNNDQVINFEAQTEEDMVTISNQEYQILLFKAKKLETYMLIETAQKSAPKRMKADKGPTKRETFGRFLAENPELLIQANGRGKAMAYAIAHLEFTKDGASTYFANFKSGEWDLPVVSIPEGMSE